MTAVAVALQVGAKTLNLFSTRPCRVPHVHVATRAQHATRAHFTFHALRPDRLSHTLHNRGPLPLGPVSATHRALCVPVSTVRAASFPPNPHTRPHSQPLKK